MTGTPPVSTADDETHLAALLAVLALTRADAGRHGTPLQQWRARRLESLNDPGAAAHRHFKRSGP